METVFSLGALGDDVGAGKDIIAGVDIGGTDVEEGGREVEGSDGNRFCEEEMLETRLR